MWNEGRLSIFDFDDCGYGVEAQDLAVTLYYLDTPEQDEALLNGYKSVRPLPTYSANAMKALLLQRRLLLLNYLFESLAVNHPFIDGNKRVAFAATDTFLRVNGYKINANSAAIYKKMMELFDNKSFRFEKLEPWLRSIVVKK